MYVRRFKDDFAVGFISQEEADAINGMARALNGLDVANGGRIERDAENMSWKIVAGAAGTLASHPFKVSVESRRAEYGEPASEDALYVYVASGIVKVIGGDEFVLPEAEFPYVNDETTPPQAGGEYVAYVTHDLTDHDAPVTAIEYGLKQSASSEEQVYVLAQVGEAHQRRVYQRHYGDIHIYLLKNVVMD